MGFPYISNLLTKYKAPPGGGAGYFTRGNPLALGTLSPYQGSGGCLVSQDDHAEPHPVRQDALVNGFLDYRVVVQGGPLHFAGEAELRDVAQLSIYILPEIARSESGVEGLVIGTD